MKIELSNAALQDYKSLPQTLKKVVNKQLKFLSDNLRHPSLHAKKYDESRDVWQARITQNHRLYFKITNSTYRIIRMIKHPK